MNKYYKKVKRIIVLLLTSALIGNTMDIPVSATVSEEQETQEGMIGDAVLGITAETTQRVKFTADKCGDNCQGHTITQYNSLVQNARILAESGTHDITISGLNITSAEVCVMPGATMNLTLQGSNKIKGFEAGIYVPEGATLVITEDSTGSLDVSGSFSAGIGGAYWDITGERGDLNCGTVIINGGTITAAGGSLAAGIGGAGGIKPPGNGGNVTINGGFVTATGGSDDYDTAPGIGGAYDNGVKGSGGTLTLSSAAVLNSDTFLWDNGKYFIMGSPTADMISVPSDMHYTSADMTEEIAGKVTLSGREETICGQTFRINTEGWNLNVTKESALKYTASYTHADIGTISKPVIILPCIHNNGAALTHHERVEADCIQTGVLEYWDCSVCGKKFSDKDGQTEISYTEIPIAAHKLIYHEKKEADCTQAGNVEYWDCSVCEKKFSDKDGQTEISDTNVVIPMESHTLVHHAKAEADCITDGNIEYWSCSVCTKLFADMGGTEEVMDVKISALGHKYNDWQSNGNGTHTHCCQVSGCGFTETEDCSGGTASYMGKAECEVCKGTYGEVLKDMGAPTGEISIMTNKWNSFLHTITFGMFFKKTEQVTITADDKESGVASVSYYIAESGMPEDEVKKLDKWTEGNTDKTTFGISNEGSCVIYAKITDNQGNVTYISSDGVVFDGTSPFIAGVTDGETYCMPQTVTVTDDNLESVIVNGKEETMSDGKFTLGAVSGEQTIKATDKAGNITMVTINVGHRYGTEWRSDKNSHWYECVCGDKSDIASHIEDNGSVTKPATETETGIMTYCCSVCGYEMRTVIIDKVVGKKLVEMQTGSSIFMDGSVLTYGQTLSDLRLNHDIFVEQGTNIKVEGSLSWKDSSIVHEAGTSEVTWIFTPTDKEKYEELIGTLTITVSKAIPDVETPVADIIIYNPLAALDNVELNGGSAIWTVGGSSVSVDGTWSWKNTNIVPSVDNSGYEAVFTPKDTKNYESVECRIALTVQKAENAPDIPDSVIDVSDNIEKVVGVTLPKGWEWQDTDKDIVLKFGEAVNAVAIYTGADKGNYKNETVKVSITKSVCNHMVGDILYTGEGEKAPACTEDGLGHRECTKCHYVMESEIVVKATGHDYIGKVTKKPTTTSKGTRTYTCTHCGDQYKESIAQLPSKKVKSVKLSKTVHTYSGKEKKPSVIAMNTDGKRISSKYYTVKYKNNKKVGKATVTVTFKNGYSGTVKKTFTIRPVKTYIGNIKAVPCGFTVKWAKKTTQTSGYQIQYSENSGFKGKSTQSIVVKKASATNKTIKNLKAGKKYYVRIRTYSRVKSGGKNINIYSEWSKVKQVKTLKKTS